MDTFNIELIGIQQEWSLDILLNESNRLNNTIRNIDESIIQEGIGDVLKTLKDKVVKFFRWLWDKVVDFFKKLIKTVKDKVNETKKKIGNINIKPKYDKAVNFFEKEYKGEEIIFGEYIQNINEFNDDIDSVLKSLNVFYNVKGLDGKFNNPKHVEDDVDFIINFLKGIYDRSFKFMYNVCNNNDDKLSLTEKIVKGYTIDNDTDKITSKNLNMNRYSELLYNTIFGHSERYAHDLEKTFNEEKKRLEDLQKVIIEKIDKFDIDENEKLKLSSKITSGILPIIGKCEQLYMSGVAAKEKIYLYWQNKAMKIVVKIISEYEKLNKKE